jgi:ABC-2 type transport system ATP-binding protein
VNECAITMTRVVKRYGPHRALDGLHLEVRTGEIFGFLGPNGAGKTTTMRVVMGLAASDAGTTEVFGAPPGSPAALRACGALIDSPALRPELSGRDHLRAVARWRGVPPARAEEVLETVGLADAGRKKTRAYSAGMRQRLGLATALLGDPDLLVLDEPGKGLDPRGQRDLRDLLGRLRDAGRTVLLSSHLLGEVEQVADRVGILLGGRLALCATPGELRARATGRVVIDARPLDRAAEALAASGLLPPESMSLTADHIAIDLSATRAVPALTDQAPVIPRLVEALVAAGLAVHRVAPDEQDLTETFLALTGASEEES